MKTAVVFARVAVKYIMVVFVLLGAVTFGAYALAPKGWTFKNDTDVPVKLFLQKDNHDYEWQDLAPLSSMDAPPETRYVLIRAHPLHPVKTSYPMRVTVTSSEGLSKPITVFDQKVDLWDLFPAGELFEK